jgi:hypothetical protein
LTKLCTIPNANTVTLIPLPNLPIIPGAANPVLTPGNNGYIIGICLACGTTYTSPANDTWQSGNFMGAVGQGNFCAQAINSTFDLAFVQHEPGAQATTPTDKPFSQNLDECLRYYCKSYSYAVKAGTVDFNGALAQTVATASYGSVYGPFRWPRIMAKAPTLNIWNPNDGTNGTVLNAMNATAYGVSGAINVGDSGYNGFTITGPPAAVAIYRFHHTGDTGW